MVSWKSSVFVSKARRQRLHSLRALEILSAHFVYKLVLFSLFVLPV